MRCSGIAGERTLVRVVAVPQANGDAELVAETVLVPTRPSCDKIRTNHAPGRVTPQNTTRARHECSQVPQEGRHGNNDRWPGSAATGGQPHETSKIRADLVLLHRRILDGAEDDDSREVESIPVPPSSFCPRGLCCLQFGAFVPRIRPCVVGASGDDITLAFPADDTVVR